MKASWLWFSPFVLAAATSMPLPAPQSPQAPVRIALTDSPAASEVTSYVNGYRKSASGQVMSYHSCHPDADSALIVRANSEAPAIEWETDPLPAEYPGDFYHIVWIAGLEREGWAKSKEPHTFEMFLNGEKWFAFQNRKDADAKKWNIAGKDGSELAFETVAVDRAGDLSGYMFLKVPRKAFRAGEPLVIRVTGDNSGNLDWYMTFRYTFRFAPMLRPESAIANVPGKPSQVVRVSIDSLSAGKSVEVSGSGVEPLKQPLEIGANILYFAVPAVDAETDLPLIFTRNGKEVKTDPVKLRPVMRRDLYLLPYAHTDIGYTEIQTAVEKKHWDNLDQALQLIKATRANPAGSRFRWNLEVLWPLEGYLARATDAKRREVIDAIRAGEIGLNAFYANVLTGLANAPEMSRFLEYARRFSAQYSIPISTAMMSDIPGFTWGTVPALAHSGVKYFASAPNPFDRIGFVLKAWGDKPFYWVSQSGEEKVLMWVAGTSYAAFHEGDATRLGDDKIFRIVRGMEERQYPYDVYQLPYTLGDNGPPDADLPVFVKHWNERYASPRLLISTHEVMFREFEKKYGAQLPAVKGDFTPYWEDGAASSAAETALNRRAVDRLLQGEALWSLRSPATFPERDYSQAWRNVVLYDEHTWGAHNSVSEPDLPEVKEQWRIKRQFALDADAQSRALLGRAQQKPPAGARPEGIDVYNLNSWRRTDVVILSREQSSAGDSVSDERGNLLASQRLSTGELAVLIENLSPFAARRLTLKPGRGYNLGTAKASEDRLENAMISLVVNRSSGAIQKLTWNEQKADLVDASNAAGLNQYWYVAGKDPAAAKSASGVRIRVKEQGSLIASLVVEADAPGTKSYSVEYRIVDVSPRVDIRHDIDKLAIREKEGVHIGFPFQVPGGQVRYQVADSVVRPETDQIAGACRNFFSIQDWVDVSADQYGVTLASIDAPLIEIGSITAELPWLETASPSQTVYSYVMNNYWHTNYRADQEGKMSFSYSLLPHGIFHVEEAVRFGRERREPFLVMQADSAVPAPSLFSLQPREVLVSSLKPASGGGWVIRLYNPTERDLDATLTWSQGFAVTKMYRSDVSGVQGAQLPGKVRVPASGTAFVRVSTK